VQKHARGQVLLGKREVREPVEREAHVFEHIQRAEQSAALIHHSKPALQVCPLFRARPDEARATDENIAGHGLVEADKVLHQAGLTAARAAQNHDDLSPMYLE
jgi:hypothetical protein